MSAFKSRFGWHPCDYATFRKLKTLHKLYWQAVYQKAAWERWERKEPQNRVMRPRIRNAEGQVVGYKPAMPRPEPKLNGFLKKQTYKTRYNRSGLYLGKEVERERVVWAFVPEYGWQDYKNARMPVETPEQVIPLKLTIEKIDELLASVQK